MINVLQINEQIIQLWALFSYINVTLLLCHVRETTTTNNLVILFLRFNRIGYYLTRVTLCRALIFNDPVRELHRFLSTTATENNF